MVARLGKPWDRTSVVNAALSAALTDKNLDELCDLLAARALAVDHRGALKKIVQEVLAELERMDASSRGNRARARDAGRARKPASGGGGQP